MPVTASVRTTPSPVPAKTITTPLAASLGKVVRERRGALGFTQEAFADYCGFFRTYLSRIETGQANPTLNTLEVLAAALKLKTSELLAATEN
jgi:transcriptional regulator with XRE-family HTH domain